MYLFIDIKNCSLFSDRQNAEVQAGQEDLADKGGEEAWAGDQAEAGGDRQKQCGQLCQV